MRSVSGPELLDKVVSESTWTESDAAYFIKQTLDLLQHLHSEGVVVVDLKVNLWTKVENQRTDLNKDSSFCLQFIYKNKTIFWLLKLWWDFISFNHKVCIFIFQPWDILLSIPGSDEVKLVDLGFARRLAASRDVRTSFGTAEFVAPEVVAGEPLSPSADVWSVGVLAYIL